MTAPTEAEIREAVDREFAGRDWTEAFWEAMSAIQEGFWETDEFRKSEDTQIDHIIEVAAGRVERVAEAEGVAAALWALREIVKIGDLPRAKEAVPA